MQTEGKELMLVTQNIDGLQSRLIKESELLSSSEDPLCKVTDQNREAFQPHIYEIHGNMNFMHSSDEDAESSRSLVRVPAPAEFEQAFAAASE